MNRDESGQQEIERRLERLGEQMRERVSMADSVRDELTRSSSSDEAASPRSLSPSFPSLREMTMTQRITFLGATTAVILVGAIWLMPSTASVSLAQVAEKLQKVSAYSVDMEIRATNGEAAGIASKGRIHYRSSGEMRMETMIGGDGPFKGDRVSVYSTDKPGITWDNQRKTYRVEPAKRGRRSPITLLHKLADYRGDATKSLGEKLIDGKLCSGFAIDMKTIDASAGAGELTLWVDTAESLPVTATFAMTGLGPLEMALSNFRWNPEFPKGFFEAKPPTGYEDKTAPAPSTDANVLAIASSLKVFAELNNGEYPRVKVVYGDVTRAKAMQLAGYSRELTREQIREEKYAKIVRATKGWATMNQIMMNNADAAYHGLKVTSDDKTNVLFRWRLPDGEYQVIYGDLTNEKVSAEQLANLEATGRK